MFEGFVIGCFRGLAAELVQWWGLRHTLHQGLPDWSRRRPYWIVTALMSLAGGGLVYLYAISGTAITGILAFNIGASAPLLLSGLAQQAPPSDPFKIK